MLGNFRSYQMAIELYKKSRGHRLPYFLKDQLERAAASVVLNLAEGSARGSKKDRMRFYVIAFTSLREVQALIQTEETLSALAPVADKLAANLYCLTRS